MFANKINLNRVYWFCALEEGYWFFVQAIKSLTAVNRLHIHAVFSYIISERIVWLGNSKS